MASGERELEERIRRHAEDIQKEGTISTSLALQLLSDLGILNERLATAERQRVEIVIKLDELIRGQVQVQLLSQRFDHQNKSIEGMREEMNLNSEFRIKFLGGSLVMRVIWVALGGIAAVVVEKFFMGR